MAIIPTRVDFTTEKAAEECLPNGLGFSSLTSDNGCLPATRVARAARRSSPGCDGVCRSGDSPALDGLQRTGADGCCEGLVVTLVLFGIVPREVGNGSVERIAPPEVRGDRDGVA